MEAVIIKVAAVGLNEKHLGMTLGQVQCYEESDLYFDRMFPDGADFTKAS